jgi:septum formation protein
MMSVQLYLASTSPARRQTLIQVGLSPEILDHSVDEEALVAQATRNGPVPPPVIVQLLARAKAEDACSPGVTGLVIGGDSVFEVDGEVFGKPHTPENARARWLRQRGQTGVLYSGHWVADVRDGTIVAGVGEHTEASVTFRHDITDEEIDAYIATGEPLKVAGAFTIDARGAAFIDRIEGDPYTVVGMSVAKLRQLIKQLGYSFTDLWE